MDERYKKDKNKWIYWVISLRPCIVNILFPVIMMEYEIKMNGYLDVLYP